MKNTVSIKENKDFRRLYYKGKTAAYPFVAVYLRKNNSEINRLGITVSTKVGKAVTRNRIKRLIREVYRLHESEIKTGIDIVVVARNKAKNATYGDIEKSLMSCFSKLSVLI